MLKKFTHKNLNGNLLYDLICIKPQNTMYSYRHKKFSIYNNSLILLLQNYKYRNIYSELNYVVSQNNTKNKQSMNARKSFIGILLFSKSLLVILQSRSLYNQFQILSHLHMINISQQLY